MEEQSGLESVSEPSCLLSCPCQPVLRPDPQLDSAEVSSSSCRQRYVLLPLSPVAVSRPFRGTRVLSFRLKEASQLRRRERRLV